jgi:hypothetical protein
MILNNFEIVVIGLRARQDRWKRCKDILEGAGVERVTHYQTEQDFSDSHKGYMKDFLTMLRYKGYTDLMFFEDDFELTPEWEEVFTKAYNDLPDNWDMLYLGANFTSKLQIITPNLARVTGAWLMHATLLRKKFIDYILRAYSPITVKIIDEWYRRIATQREFYVTMPMISYQRPDFSDMVGQYVNYQIFENKHYKRAYEYIRTSSQLPASPKCRSGVDGT